MSTTPSAPPILQFHCNVVETRYSGNRETLNIDGGDIDYNRVTVELRLRSSMVPFDISRPVSITISQSPPVVHPWKPEEVPLGAQMRQKGATGSTRLLITAVNTDGRIWLGAFADDSDRFARDYECSTDGGRTWRPAGRVEGST